MATINGTSAADVLLGSTGNDSMAGLAGDDSFTPLAGDDTVDGGAGSDTLIYTSATGPVNVNLVTGKASGEGNDVFTSIEQVFGSAFNDVLTGGNPVNGTGMYDGFEGFRGNAGNDTIDGGPGFDRARYDNSPAAVVVHLGGHGIGTVQDGFGGTDQLLNIEEVRGSAFDDLMVGTDSDAYESFEGMAGNDTLDGGSSGDNRVVYSQSPVGVTVNLTTGTASDGWGGTDKLINITSVRGSAFDDLLIGSDTTVGPDGVDFGERFRGAAGNDTIDGKGGFDFAFYDDSTGAITANMGAGGSGTVQDGLGGTDTLFNIEEVRGSALGDTLSSSADSSAQSFEGMAGNDTITGLGLDDRASYSQSPKGVVVNLATGSASDGWGGTDTLVGVEDVRGSLFDDVLTGSAANNQLKADDGNDTLRGNGGNDTLDGGSGTDTAQYSGKLGDYKLTVGIGAAATTLVSDTRSGADGADRLQNIERLQFSDVSVALDLGTQQAAGKAVLVMAAALGSWFPAQKDWAGTFLRFFDSGAGVADGTNLLVAAGIMSAFAGGSDNTSFVKWVYGNVYGSAPDAATLQTLVAALDNHSTTQAAWMADMALSAANQQHVNLAGYAASGWQYI